MTAGVPLLNATEWVDTEAALSGSLLGRHMVCILKNDYAKDSHKCARNTALVVSGALSASAKAAFINVTLAGIPGGWGYAAAGCNVAAWFVLELWAALGIIGSSELGIPTSAQIEIRKKFLQIEQSPLLSLALHSLSLRSLKSHQDLQLLSTIPNIVCFQLLSL